ncbi:hypothetical protein EHS25_005481 [Saitozyma podzolica]|uniref:Transmembrane protein 14C n=1 Tax=Saitozyma podzolica TaxID=1890683 RepID=A0A427XYA5_9TREE|nr:hypothetical protein EHS25_005481 [Saitozyma podzolica]
MPPLVAPRTDYLGYAYAATLVAGGLFGAVRRGSVISLISGALFGGAAGYGAYLNSLDPTDIKVPLAVSTVLCIIMTARMYMTSKLMPAGVISVLSLIMLSRYAIIVA